MLRLLATLGTLGFFGAVLLFGWDAASGAILRDTDRVLGSSFMALGSAIVAGACLHYARTGRQWE